MLPAWLSVPLPRGRPSFEAGGGSDSPDQCQASGENRMGRTIAAFVVAASLLPFASSDAAAWVCRAVGLGSSGYAGAYDIIDAKLFALRQCERRSPLPVCTLVWCRPGGSRIMSTAPVTDMPWR